MCTGLRAVFTSGFAPSPEVNPPARGAEASKQILGEE